MLASVRPRDLAGKTRRRIAAEVLADLIAVEATMTKATAELKVLVRERGSHLTDNNGIGPVVAARVLAGVGDLAWFADRNRFASWTGTAPLDASSGEQNRHRLSRAGTLKPTREPHDPHRPDQPATDRHRRAGLLPAQARRRQETLRALRCLKRRISDAIYRQLVTNTPAVPCRARTRAREGTTRRL
jgi:transposase